MTTIKKKRLGLGDRRRREKWDKGPKEKGKVGQGTEGEGESGTRDRRRRRKLDMGSREKEKVGQGTE